MRDKKCVSHSSYSQEIYELNKAMYSLLSNDLISKVLISFFFFKKVLTISSLILWNNLVT